MTENLDNFYLSKPEPVQGCLLALRSIILQLDDHITFTIKYGMPCFCYHNKAFCYLWTDKKTGNPYILFVEGKHLNHPSLETGDRARMKILRVDPKEDLPLAVIQDVLNQALDLYRNGIIKIK